MLIGFRRTKFAGYSMADFLDVTLNGIGGRGSTLDEEPVREELFSVERLEQYAAELAAEHTWSSRKKHPRLLFRRLEENGRKLVAVYRALAEAIRDDHTGSPAAEWLVGNFHIVEEQLGENGQGLP